MTRRLEAISKGDETLRVRVVFRQRLIILCNKNSHNGNRL